MDPDHHSSEKDKAKARLEGERNRVAELESTRPLRRRIFKKLADAWPRQVGLEELEAGALPSGATHHDLLAEIARMEGERVLQRGEFFGVPCWWMTRWGRSEYNAHLALGIPDPLPPRPMPEESRGFFEEAIEGALSFVHADSGRDEALERLQLIAELARESELEDIAVRAETAIAGLP